ncbi:thioesterase domain-containing protein [Bacillus sp. FJAT-53711]|uniref:Thioesterase domain-containing protein n=1 Tax=Bacillus yunxiaonensis TaxID=3127665 RepID=A0ABU8FZW1_9BACI
MKLFCLPYAGGSSTIFYHWKKNLYPKIELASIELPGRGKRSNEPLIENYDLLINDLLDFIDTNTKYGEEIQLFGHSLGGLLAYSIAKYVEKNTFSKYKIKHLYLSGTRPPNVILEDSYSISSLPNKEFISKLTELGGMDEEILNCQELIDYLLPSIRADFLVLETFNDINDDYKLKCPTTLINGINDSSVIFHEKKWENYLENIENITRFEGGHFFINEYPELICKLIINNPIHTFQKTSY